MIYPRDPNNSEAVPSPANSLIVVHDDTAAAHVLHVFGDVDIYVSEELSAEIAQVGGFKPLVIDLSECRYVDSTALTVFVRAKRTLGDRLRFVVPEDARIARILAVTRLRDALGVYRTLELASTSAAKPERSSASDRTR